MSKADAHSTLSHFYVYALFRESGVPLYIGKGCGDRWLHHEKRARNGVGGYKHEIIRGMQARGLEVIKVKLHEGLTEAVAHAYEVALIRAIGRGQAGPLVNLTDGGDGVSGFKHPPGKKRSPEHVAKVAAARRGKKFSPESLAKLSASHLGKPVSLEARAKLRAAFVGKKHSPEHIEKRTAPQRGKKNTAEARAKMSAAHQGRKLSPEHRASQSAARLGKSRSAETRARVTAGLRAFHARRRAEALLPAT
jgi:hypothetical protein